MSLPVDSFSIAGGMFGKEAKDPSTFFPWTNRSCLKTVNARSAFYFLCRTLRPPTVWLPSFICPEMITAANTSSMPVAFYPIDRHLHVQNHEWVSNVQPKDVVLAVDYFGFEPPGMPWQALKNRRVWIVQDAAQSLLSEFSRPYADFILFSPRKHIGVPSGGILLSRDALPFSMEDLQPAPKTFSHAAERAFHQRTAYDGNLQTEWYSSYCAAEAIQPVGAYRMEIQTEQRLQSGFTLDKIRQSRRTNYSILLNALQNHALFKSLPDKVTPIGFPMYTMSRNRLRDQLWESRLYCPIHWHLEQAVPQQFEESHELSRRVITLLCDQRVSKDQLRQIISIVQESA